MDTLIIVDMQKGLINDNNRFLLEKINNLLKHKKFDNIVATQFVNSEDSQYIKSLKWNKMFFSPDIDLALDLPENAVVVKKSSYGLPLSVFKEGMLDFSKFKLDKVGGGRIVICGTDYDACVLAIGFQLFDHGFAPQFITECIGSASRKLIDKSAIERIMIRNFGENAVICEDSLFEQNSDQM